MPLSVDECLTHLLQFPVHFGYLMIVLHGSDCFTRILEAVTHYSNHNASYAGISFFKFSRFLTLLEVDQENYTNLFLVHTLFKALKKYPNDVNKNDFLRFNLGFN